MLRFDLDVTVRRGLHGVNERLARLFTPQTPELLGRDDDHFLTSVHGDVLGSLAAGAAHEFAETRLGVLQQPMARE
jgi:hypothetical protein